MDDIIRIEQPEMLEALNRAEIDIQITTAKKYPRVLDDVLNRIKTYAENDVETAEDCFYALRRKSSDGSVKLIEGISVRLAEIFASAWGNIRIQTRIIGNDGRTITAQGLCHDLESNLAVSVEVKRRITDKRGRTYSEDMQVVTGNAASAIAFRNAVLKVIPKAITKRIVDEIKDVAMGKSLDLETSRQRAISHFSKIGVDVDRLLNHLERSSVEEVTAKDVFYLRGLSNSIKEGTTTVDEAFAKPADTKTETEKTAEKVTQKIQATKKLFTAKGTLTAQKTAEKAPEKAPEPKPKKKTPPPKPRKK